MQLPKLPGPSRRMLVGALLVAAGGLSQAQPATIKVVVPYPAGGVTDQAARLMAEKMGPILGQTIIIDNRPGAGGRIGIEAVMKAPADGNTLLFTNTSYSILPITDPKAPYDAQKSLAPVGIAATYGLAIVTNLKVPANTLPEFIAYAKKNPGKLSYGSAGLGSGAHFAGEYFKALTGTHIVHIPYKSTAAALIDVAGGVLDLAFDASVKPLVDAGKVKLLAVTDDTRDPRFPQVPTATEAGVKGFVQQSWVGFLAPASTPPATIERLNKALAAASADTAVRKRMSDMGLVPQGGSPSQMEGQIRKEVALFRKIAADTKLQFE